MNDMKSVGRKMSLLMGVTMSFCLSLTGLVSAGQFSVPALIINFLISFVISMIIGFLVPMGRVNASLTRKLGLRPGTLAARLFETLISDLIYTPIITIVMVTMAYRQAVSHGAPLHYGPMVGHALLISMIVGYIIIYIVTPVFMKIAGAPMGPGGPGGPGGKGPGGPGTNH